MRIEHKEIMGEHLIVISKEKVKAPSSAIIKYLSPSNKLKLELEIDYDYYKGLSKDDKRRLEAIIATTVIQTNQVVSMSSYKGEDE